MKILNAIVGLSLLGAATAAQAQEFPQPGRTITMIVPSSAGGGTDTAARMIAPEMEKDLGVPIEVVNKPGASMQIGLSEAVRAKPDGYTLVWSVLPTAASIYLDPDRGASFDRSALAPLGNVYGAPFAVSVPADSPYETIEQLVADAKAKPGKLKSGTTGFMSTGHFANIEFQQSAGVDMATVNFQGGGPELTALLGSHIDVAFNSIGELLSQNEAGTIRILAVMDDERSDYLPEVPTLKESGVDAAPSGSYVGVSAPAGVPQPILDRLEESLKTAVMSESVTEKMKQVGNTVMYMPPSEYTEFWDRMDGRLKDLIAVAKKQSE